MDLRSTQLKDTYGNLVTTGTTAGSPTSGGLQNGQGTLLTSVGIGTNSPSNTLSVFSSGASAITIVDVVGGSTGAGVLQLSAGTTLGSASFDILQNSAGAFLNQRDNNPMSFYVNNDEKIRIEADGDIAFYDDANNQGLFWDASAGSLGIGTDSPSTALDILGDLTVRRAVASTQYTQIQSGGGESKIIAKNGASALYQGLVFESGNNTTTTERMRIDSSGNVSITTGNLILDSGAGIDFSDTPNSSGTMTSELLDDYEEGTWTPVLSSAGGTPSGTTYSYRNATYTKVGRAVTVTGGFLLSNKGTGGSGETRIDGLPFAQRSTGAYGEGTAAVAVGGLTTAALASRVDLFAANGAAYLRLRLNENDADLDFTTEITNTTYIKFCCIYFV